MINVHVFSCKNKTGHLVLIDGALRYSIFETDQYGRLTRDVEEAEVPLRELEGMTVVNWLQWKVMGW